MDKEGKPDGYFVPDFSRPVDQRFPSEGCYLAKLIFYKGIMMNSTFLFETKICEFVF